jgi:hypothetical protein
METVFSKLIGKQVKALFLDDGKTKVVMGILNEVTENYIVVEDVIIGLGSNFISCIPQENNRRMF